MVPLPCARFAPSHPIKDGGHLYSPCRVTQRTTISKVCKRGFVLGSEMTQDFNCPLFSWAFRFCFQNSRQKIEALVSKQEQSLSDRDVVKATDGVQGRAPATTAGSPDPTKPALEPAASASPELCGLGGLCVSAWDTAHGSSLCRWPSSSVNSASGPCQSSHSTQTFRKALEC